MNNNILADSEKFPSFLRLLFFVEMWERFSYYGMRALLVLFLTSKLGFSDANAYAVYSLFAALGYAGPVLGGILADKLLGFRNMVIIGGVIIAIGHAMMAFATIHKDLVFIALAFMAVGTGFFKGNITSLLGACYKEDDPSRAKGFTLFYVSVNLGSFLASISCGYIASYYGWHYGFGLAGIGMIVGLSAFIKFQYILGDKGNPPSTSLMQKRFLGLSPFGIVFCFGIAIPFLVALMLKSSELYANILMYFGVIIFGTLIYQIFKMPTAQRNSMVALAIYIIFLMIFFALEMQLGSLINLFTERNVSKELMGFTIPASVFQALNPLSIITLGFLFGTYIKFDKKYDILRFALGLSTMAICFFVLYIGCINASLEGKVAPIYLIIAISFMGLGELCVAPFVQSQVTLLAPKRLKGFVMGILMLSLAFSNLAGVLLSKFMSVPSVNGEINFLQSLEIYKNGFWDIAVFNLLITLAFILFAPLLRKNAIKS